MCKIYYKIFISCFYWGESGKVKEAVERFEDTRITWSWITWHVKSLSKQWKVQRVGVGERVSAFFFLGSVWRHDIILKGVRQFFMTGDFWRAQYFLFIFSSFCTFVLPDVLLSWTFLRKFTQRFYLRQSPFVCFNSQEHVIKLLNKV